MKIRRAVPGGLRELPVGRSNALNRQDQGYDVRPALPNAEWMQPVAGPGNLNPLIAVRIAQGASRVRTPTGTELAQNFAVLQAIEQAWLDSKPNEPGQRHEEGGWIYLNTTTGVIFTHRANRGIGDAIDLSGAILYNNAIVVGTFHTHPNPSFESWIGGPSNEDLRLGNIRGVPGLIRSDQGISIYGPESRECLDGHPGYPTF